MCAGRVDLSFIFRAFAKGADGVMVGGCHPGDCHYVTQGNYDALVNTHIARKLLVRIGLKPERLRLEWIAASEGAKFAEVMSDFSAQMRALGGLGKAEELSQFTLKLKIAAVSRLIPYLKLVERERLRPATRSVAAIDAFFESDETNKLFDELIAGELVNSQILLLLGKGGPLSTAALSEKLGLSSSAVAKQMKSTSVRGLVAYDRETGTFGLSRMEA